MAIKVVQTPLRWSVGADYLWWPLAREGEYSVKSGYQEIWKANREVFLGPSGSSSVHKGLWGEIWGATIPQKIKIFLWKSCWNILPVRENLSKKRIVSSGICPFCHLEVETVEHAFFFCEWVRPVWLGLQVQVIPNRDEVSSLDLWLSNKFQLFKQDPASQEFATISICCALWLIWKQRNTAVFEHKSPNPMSTVMQINSLINELLILNNSNRNPQQSSRVGDSNRWRPPRRDIIKINTDAGYNSHNQVGSGGIIARDWKGDVVFGLTKKFPATSPLIAEALVLREAAAVAVNFGLSRVVLESDCLDLIYACRKETVKGEIINIVDDIIHFAQELSWCGFTWVKRQGNSVAHLLAELTMSNAIPLHWRWNHPPALQRCLHLDKDGIILREP